MSIVSSSDHWMFVSSKGALTAGRGNANNTLFPYYPADRLRDLAHSTGPKSMIRLENSEGSTVVWEPFSQQEVGDDSVHQNIYKNTAGNRICFEEVNETLELTFRYTWSFGNRFGFIRDCSLINDSMSERAISILDGVQNLMPFGLEQHFQLRFSNLANAYKKSELLPGTGLGIFYLSSIPTDRAEPSEGLKATTVWYRGFQSPTILLSANQLNRFRQGKTIQSEREIRGIRGAFFVQQELLLDPASEKQWTMVADVGQDQTDVNNLNHYLQSSPALSDLPDDIRQCQTALDQIVASSDGRQMGRDKTKTDRHQTNVLFNIMRGGLPANGYQIEPDDFRQHVKTINSDVANRHRGLLSGVNAPIEFSQLLDQLADHKERDPDLLRVTLEYLPLTFSRRHGDPSRPWNSFAISARRADGLTDIDYEGNWRDIFQNWEALAVSFPQFTANMIFKFVNASTADGYNPFRISKTGFEWEEPAPNDPWANIGYWGDHQIIYMLKLLEWSHRFEPSCLERYLDRDLFVYANVPYRIRPYDEILRNQNETIEFDEKLSTELKQRCSKLGTDGKLCCNGRGEIHHVAFAEKLLVPLLAKMTNFVPDGGIWLNTQRPEWNDANNALVGNGLSMVTVYYLRRFLDFLINWISQVPHTKFAISIEVAEWFDRLFQVLEDHQKELDSGFDPASRREMVNRLSKSGCQYREKIYDSGFSGKKTDLPASRYTIFLKQCLKCVDRTIQNNQRDDGLYHSYNLLALGENRAEVQPLQEMLEGQVAVLSSGILSPVEAIAVLDSLHRSRMYRPDQDSFMLYPDKKLPTFLEKNRIPSERVYQSKPLMEVLSSGDTTIIRQDTLGGFHFDGRFRNATELNLALEELANNSSFHSDITPNDRREICQLFEDVFDHRSFTGRSGTFYGYEGLGSIYWHMVSKLALAAQENFYWAIENQATDSILNQLSNYYWRIRRGIGDGKSPEEYGAFPSDPYSHTPKHSGPRQPGMTGQVKEDILARRGELGIMVDNGILSFCPILFDSREFLSKPCDFEYVDVEMKSKRILLPKDSFAFTVCQVPVVYHRADASEMVVHNRDGETHRRRSTGLTPQESQDLFARRGVIEKIELSFDPDTEFPDTDFDTDLDL